MPTDNAILHQIANTQIGLSVLSNHPYIIALSNGRTQNAQNTQNPQKHPAGTLGGTWAF